MNFYNYKNVFILLIVLITVMSCHKDSETNPEDRTIRFCHITDPHYFSPDLLINDGTAFQNDLLKDRKMLAESKAILESAISVILKEKPKFVMISGDLTKDGEKQGHMEMAQYLSDLEKTGIKVYVCPGNHDINNTYAKSYDGDNFTMVENVNSEEFRSIYGKFGYDEAIYRDPNSLSYVASPDSSVWVLSIDACDYSEDYVRPVIAGKISSESLTWIKNRLDEAAQKGIRVFAMMHHGLVEHFTGQKGLYPEYVLDDWENVSEELSSHGLNYIFTGHFHAQDIVKRSMGDNFIFDIETGSLVSYPSPVRVIDYNMTEEELNIESKNIESINYDLGGENFTDYAYNRFSEELDHTIPKMLYFVEDKSQIPLITPAVKEAFLAHYSGDEGTPSEEFQQIVGTLKGGSGLMLVMEESIQNVYNDPAPADNNLRIDVTDGSVK